VLKSKIQIVIKTGKETGKYREHQGRITLSEDQIFRPAGGGDVFQPIFTS